MNDTTTLRAACQIQIAHDVLTQVMLGQIPLELGEAERKHLHACLDVLCWVLCHDHNAAFATNLQSVMRDIEAMGYRLREVGGAS